MVEISFEIKGQIVEPDSMPDVLDILFLKHIRDVIENSLASVHCPKHNREPSVKVLGPSIDNLTYEISGCCQDLIEKTRENIK